MTNQVMLERPALESNDALLVWLFIASIIHVVIILGVNFNKPKRDEFSRSIEITIVNSPAKKAPKDAKTLAQENQVGAGEQSAKPQMTEQKIATVQPVSKKQIKNDQPESKPKTVHRTLTQRKAEKAVAQKPVEIEESQPEEAAEQTHHLSPDLLQQQITQLGTEIRHSQLSADESKIKTVNMVSAHKYLAAQYMKDWEDKVERMGNLNYPQVAAKKNFSASLSMDVGIKTDGNIYSIRVSRSSGIPELDEAAKNIVRLSAPFAPLPLELQKEVNVLVITRIWKFSDEAGMSTR